MLSKETLICFSPRQISHQVSLSPTQPISQSVHILGSVTGQGEGAGGREAKMRKKKEEVNEDKNGTMACPGGSEQKGSCHMFTVQCSMS